MKPIRASEISSYFYCPVCWWIGITEGVKITNAMIEGEKHHEHIAGNVSKARVIYACIVILIFFIAALLIGGFLL